MKILSLETSCDETSAAVVENGKKVLGLSIASSLDLHKETGGVVPEVAAREHPLKVWPVIESALDQAKIGLKEIDAVASTTGPGLMPALLTGYLTAKTIAFFLDKPFIPVHHTFGHIYSNFLREAEIIFPIVVLTVSGGHNDLILIKDHFDFEILGRTQDDAAGEAFDKVARLLGLSYPGGPEISKKAEKGNLKEVNLPTPWMNETTDKLKWDRRNFNFSFSGLKSAVRRLVVAKIGEKGDLKDLDQSFVDNCAATFQNNLTEVLAEKAVAASKKYKAKELHLAGGVSANTYLRQKIMQKIKEQGSEVVFRFPEKFIYCTDNAAMIGSVAYFQFKNNIFPNISDVDSSLDLDLFQK